MEMENKNGGEGEIKETTLAMCLSLLVDLLSKNKLDGALY